MIFCSIKHANRPTFYMLRKNHRSRENSIGPRPSRLKLRFRLITVQKLLVVKSLCCNKMQHRLKPVYFRSNSINGFTSRPVTSLIDPVGTRRTVARGAHGIVRPFVGCWLESLVETNWLGAVDDRSGCLTPVRVSWYANYLSSFNRFDRLCLFFHIASVADHEEPEIQNDEILYNPIDQRNDSKPTRIR
jgi:hypothetical protein